MPDLRTFVLAARKTLIRETEEQFVQLFGLKPTGEFLPEREVAALPRLAGAMETRRKLKQLLTDEQEAGIPPGAALSKLTKEIAFTHLNRLVALKLLEGMGLIRGALNKWHNSNGFLFYRADVPEVQKLFELGSHPADDRGEGPSDRAYRHFLLWQYGKLADEIKVLFDPDNLASQLFPRPLVLRGLVDVLNSDALKEFWADGNEDTVGWVYQAFNSEELEAAFSAARQSGKKFAKEDIAAVTQLFTPRLAVRFLVENSLGRLWVKMHPDSHLAVELRYLIPLPASSEVPALKPVNQIRLLDPACGTMHFGLVAFDWLVKMYQEELDNAGKPGWPVVPSVKSVDEIPAEILANNLFGIDIDLRAVQLSALTLYLRAKRTNKNARLTESRLTCADIAIFRGQHLNKIENEMSMPKGVTRDLFSKFCESVDAASQMGSLVRLETHFRSFEAERLRTTIDEYVARKAAEGEDESYFANESSKGLRLLDALTREYDVVFTNPPYISGRKMNPEMSGFMKANYRECKGDLYAGFIQRCLELLKPDGYVAMLTMHSFMFISGYEKLRTRITSNAAIRSMAHFGPGLFAVGNPGTLQTTAFVVQRGTAALTQTEESGVYVRLVKEPDAERKQVAYEEAVGRRQRGEADPRVYVYRQEEFAAIPGSPWVYWADDTVKTAFAKFPSLKSLYTLDMGLKTSGNVRFVRHWWEVGQSRIGNPTNREEAANTVNMKWFWFSKGDKGTGISRLRHVVNWKEDGKEVKAHLFHQYPYLNGNAEWCTHNENLYFRPCITWSPVSSTGFRARIVPPGVITSNAAYGIFAEDEILTALYSYLISTPGRYLIKILCSTINHNKGDLEKLPVPTGLLRATDFVRVASARLKGISDADAGDETASSFIAPGTGDVAEPDQDSETELDACVIHWLGLKTELSFMRDLLSLPLDDEGSPSSDGSADDDDEDDDGAEEESSDNSARSELNIERAKAEIAYAVGIAVGRFQPGQEGAIGRGLFTAETATRLRTLASPDGVAVLERGHPDDLAQRVWEILVISKGDDEAEKIVRAATGSSTDLRDALESHLLGAFFKEHVKRYRKRPVYWLLQSPRRTFSVYLFQERATSNTLSTLQGTRYLGGRINRLETELADLQRHGVSLEGKESARVKKRTREIADALEDLKAFDTSLQAANQVPITNVGGSQQTVRWEPEFDDGVLLNAAALHELAPAWKSADAKLDLKKTWKELEAGKYDWAKTAMRYWPARVINACKSNKSLAIAHGLA